MMYFLIYFLVLLFLLLLFYIINTHYFKIFSFLIYKLEEVIFIFTKRIYYKKEEILRYEEVIDVLFLHKRKFIEEGDQYDIGNINKFFRSFFGDIEVLSKMISEEVISQEEKSKIKEYINIILKLSYIRRYLYILISVYTLGIFVLFVRLK